MRPYMYACMNIQMCLYIHHWDTLTDPCISDAAFPPAKWVPCWHCQWQMTVVRMGQWQVQGKRARERGNTGCQAYTAPHSLSSPVFSKTAQRKNIKSQNYHRSHRYQQHRPGPYVSQGFFVRSFSRLCNLEPNTAMAKAAASHRKRT